MKRFFLVLLLCALCSAQKFNYQRDLQNYTSVSTTPPLAGGGSIGVNLNFSLTTCLNGQGLETLAGVWTCQPFGSTTGGVNTQTTNYTLTATDSGQLVIMNCSSACTVTLFGTPSNKFFSAIESIGSSVATVSLNGLKFNGATGVPVLISDQVLPIWSDGTNYFGQAPPVAGSQVAFTPAANGLTISVSSSQPFNLGGDGSDGAAVADGSTAAPCLGSPSSCPGFASGCYTMTRDCYFTTLNENSSSATIFTNNFVISGTVSCTISGTVENNGNPGNAGSASLGGGGVAGAGSGSGHYARVQNSIGGTSGGTGTTGNGNQATTSNSGNGANHAVDGSGTSGCAGTASGSGGNGQTGTGGASQTGGIPGTVLNVASISGHNVLSAFYGAFWNASTLQWQNYAPPSAGCGGAAGGGGGGGDGTNKGGNGGGGGSEGGGAGDTGMFCKSISITATGIISSNAGQGGQAGSGQSPGVGNTGGGGEGAPGNGGIGGINWLVYQTLVNLGTIEALGGQPGIHGTPGTGNGSGTNGQSSSNAHTGNNGVNILIQTQ